MAKAKELHDMPVAELEKELSDTKEELFNLRFQHATGQLDNYRRLRYLRRDIARIKTVLRKKELDAEHATTGGGDQ